MTQQKDQSLSRPSDQYRILLPAIRKAIEAQYPEMNQRARKHLTYLRSKKRVTSGTPGKER